MPDNAGENDISKNILTMGLGELGLWKRGVMADPALFKQLFQNIFSADHRLAWRSCWIIDTASEDYPGLLSDKLSPIITALLSTRDGSLKRHFTRILCRYEVPEESLGLIIDRCFELLLPAEPAAVRVNAMQLLFNISQKNPDLKGELKSVIETLMEEGGSAGFINRCKKLLRKL
jgi:hypothetical protein